MKQLRSMSFDELVALRDQVESMLSAKAATVKKELEEKLLEIETYTRRTPAPRRQHALKGRKLAPKYRNPEAPDETWAGRGAMPRWLKALVASGRKLDEFAVDQGATHRAKRAVKRGRPKKR